MYTLLSTKALFRIRISILYSLSLVIIFYAFQPPPVVPRTTYAAIQEQKAPQTAAKKDTTISGRPTRIVVPGSLIDLQISDGSYSDETNTWTLSDTQAQYATMTSLANDQTGSTFIYGHGTDQVLGKLVSIPPTDGSIAHIYTDNGHIISYIYQARRELTENDTSILDYEGPPVLMVQTCTGIFSEWRTVFEFKYDRVIQ